MTERTLILTPRLLDGLSDSAREHAFVAIEGATVTAVGNRSELADNASEQFDRTIDLGPEASLLPGLINMHTHLSFSAVPSVFADAVSESDATKMIRIVENMRAALAAGITTVRDCGTWPRLALPARDAVESGLAPGPRIVASGAITTTGGHCWFCATEADSEPEIRKAVRAHLKEGVDFIKLFATGGNTTPGSNALVAQYTEQQMCAATEEAVKAGRRTAAHAHGLDGVRHSIRARVTTIEHCSFQTEAGIGWDDDLVKEIVDAGIYVCPTVFRGVGKRVADSSYTFTAGDERFLTGFKERLILTRRLAERGVQLVSGNDAGVSNCHISDFPGDLVETVEGCGIAASEVIRSATSRAAEALGRPDLGVIAAGKAADLLAVRGDPLANPCALRSPTMVMARGQVVATF